MLTSATAVIERRLEITGDHTTHPYEAGWAAEAIFFVQVEGAHPDLVIQPQISPDGIHWVDRGKRATLGAQADIAALEIRRFGTWLRLSIQGADPQHTATILVHLAMKG